MFALFIIITILQSIASEISDIPSLPYCPDQKESGVVIVSTLDGKLSAINSSGSLVWEVDTGPGPLLLSNIHKLELTNNGEWIRIIPSLTGTLYKFDGTTIDPIPITAEELLKSSFRYSDDLVIAGGIEVRTYGVGFRSGTLYYECTSIKCSNKEEQNVDDLLLIERSTHTIRAVEPTTGNERWNFSVGLHNVKLPKVSCINPYTQFYDWNVTAVLPEGKIKAFITYNKDVQSWTYIFSSPIVRIWRWTGKNLSEIDLFSPKNIQQPTANSLCPSIYVAMYNKQLYVHESDFMQKAIYSKVSSTMAVAESKSIAKIPWKPVPASSEVAEDDSTALSVLNGSEYVNGQGFYLYTEKDLNENNSVLCEANDTHDNFIENVAHEENEELEGFFHLVFWYDGRKLSLMVITIIICHFLFRMWHHQKQKRDVIIIKDPIDTHAVVERRISERENDDFTSRYLTDFDTLRCLGKGGFGVVFEVKQKIDECSYAIKRITLPNKEKSRDRVMREVKALAKLEHQNIVRYFCSWVERPPWGWQQEHDRKWIGEESWNSDYSQSLAGQQMKRCKSASISIEIDCRNCDTGLPSIVHESDIDEDSFIVFENSAEDVVSKSDSTIKSEHESSFVNSSEHSKKKIDWRRPSRTHHSWDLTQNNCIKLEEQKPDPPIFLYIQMQLCQKESLKEWLKMNLQRDHAYILQIFLQILEAVEYVHQQGLIHRDLKPSNIFFSLDGKVKVGDFGLVKDTAFDLEIPKLKKGLPPSKNHEHTVEVGTQLYMSPEQIVSRNYDYKVDIYSLGLIFFELLVPFSTDMEKNVMMKNVKKNKYPADFPKKYPDEYGLLQNMLSEDPEKRLTTIGIRARAPFNQDVSGYSEDCHYKLNHFQKN